MERFPAVSSSFCPQLRKAHGRARAGGQVRKDDQPGPLVDDLVQPRALSGFLGLTHCPLLADPISSVTAPYATLPPPKQIAIHSEAEIPGMKKLRAAVTMYQYPST